MSAATAPAHRGLVGRDRELSQLRELLRGAAHGRGGTLLVVGEAGVGKTALLRAAADDAPVPVTWVSGAEDPAGADLLVAPGPGAGTAARVVMADDADLFEPAALEALTAAVRRADDDQVLLICAGRAGGRAEAALAGVDQLVLEGLHPRQARAVLAEAAPAPVEAAVAEELVASTGANPLVLQELAGVLNPDQLGGRQPLPRPLPVGDRLAAYHRARLRHLPGRTRRALLVVAASFGNPAVVADGLTRLGLSPTDLDEAERAGLLSRVGGRLELRPALARSALYQAASAGERHDVHRALAAASAAAKRTDRQAWHLARAVVEADEATASLIEASAWARLRAGEAADAAADFEAAARLSPDPVRAAERSVSACETWLIGGCVGRARSLADQVLARDLPERTRARAALVRGRTLLVGGEEEADGRRYLTERAAEVGPAHPDLAAVMAATASASALRSGELGQALAAAREAASWAERGGPGTAVPSLAAAEVTLASARLAAGDTGAAPGLVEAALADLAGPRLLLTACPIVLVGAGVALVWAEETRRARTLLERLTDAARSFRLASVLSQALCTRALLEHRDNRWEAAEAAATEALEIARSSGQSAVVPYATAMLATAEAVLGRADACRDRCLRLLGTPGGRVPLLRSAVLSALGLLELGEGRPDQAVRWYEVLAGSGGSPDRSHPGIVMWGADLAEAYLDAGQQAKAAVVADQLEERARSLGSARAGAAAKRVRAMLCADDEEAEALFAEALRHYGGPEWRFARARIELARGRRLARSGRRSDAERRLSRSFDLFGELGARGWSARVADELRRLGVPPGVAGGTDRAPALTVRERQVALAAAMGGLPADMAAGLFLPEAEVAAALRSAAAKLGVEPEALPERLGQLAPDTWVPPADQADDRGDDAPQEPAPAGGQTRVRLLGDCALTGPSSTHSCPPGPGGYLVKRLALARRLPVEEVIEELWPDAAPGLGRNRLRTALTRLRRSVGPVVVREGGWLALAPDVEVDARAFEEAADAAQAAAADGVAHAGAVARHALALYGGELLPLDRHLAFTAAPRERLRRRYLAVVGLAVADAAGRGETDSAVRMLEDAIRESPLEEDLYVRAAVALAGAGRAPEAAAVLRRARAALAELELPLSPAAEELLVRLS